MSCNWGAFQEKVLIKGQDRDAVAERLFRMRVICEVKTAAVLRTRGSGRFNFAGTVNILFIVVDFTQKCASWCNPTRSDL